MVIRLEPLLSTLFVVCWLLALFGILGLVPLEGALKLGNYPLFILAAVAGWLFGNVYLARSGALPREIRRRILLVYFLGPLGVLYLLRIMAPFHVQAAAPLVPLYSLGVFTVFFLVPVSFKGAFASRGQAKLDGHPRHDDKGTG